MKNAALLLMVFIIASNVVAQGYRSATETIRTVEEAVAYENGFPSVRTQFVSNEFDYNFIGKALDTLEPGELYNSGYYEVRVIAHIEKEVYRFNMISLYSNDRTDAAQLVDSMKVMMQRGTKFRQIYADFMPPPPITDRPAGEMGWVDIDIFEDSLRLAIERAELNEVITVHDAIKGVHHLVWMTDESKKATGSFVLYYPLEYALEFPAPRINHVDTIKGMATANLVSYAKEYQDEVFLELVTPSTNPSVYEEIQKRKNGAHPLDAIFYDGDERHYRWIKDTTLELFSFQYVYLDEFSTSKKECKKTIRSIKKRLRSGISFSEIASEYWPDNNGYKTLEDVDAGLLDHEFVTKLNATKLDKLFVNQSGQSYFIGVLTSPKRTEEAFLVLTIPF